MDFAVTAPPPPAWIWLMLLAAGAIATVPDVREHRIPNWLTFPLLAAGLAYAAISGGFAGLGSGLAGAAIASSVFVIGYILAGGGAGDAKLMMGLGAWLGWTHSLPLLFCVLVTGMVGVMVGLLFRGGVRGVLAVIFDGIGGGLGRLLHGRRSDAEGKIESQPGATTGPRTGRYGFRRRQKEWFPYAPAILAGTAIAWWYVEMSGELP